MSKTNNLPSSTTSPRKVNVAVIFFPESLAVNCLNAFEVDGPVLPVHANTNRQNVAFSTSITPCSDSFFLLDS